MPRKQTGHTLYLAEQRGHVMAEIKGGLKKGERVRDTAVTSEVKKRWNNLPNASRDIWESRARK